MTTDEKLEEILTWQRNHTESDNARFSGIEATLKNIPGKEDIKTIVDFSIQENITKKGTAVKNIIITVAIVITSVVAIGVGLKTFLGWWGISLTRL